MIRWFRRFQSQDEEDLTFAAQSEEERELRGKLILAARKLQQVQQSLAGELDAVHSLSALLRNSDKRLASLEAAQGMRISGLEQEIRDLGLQRMELENAHTQEMIALADESRGRIANLEIELRRSRATISELKRRLADREQGAEEPAGESPPAEPPDASDSLIF